MALQDKYKELIDAAKSGGTVNLQVAEQDGVLHITGEAPSNAAKDKLWDIYGKIDPNYLTGDVVMNISTATAVEGAQLKVVTQQSNLNIRTTPGTDATVAGKAAHGDQVTLIRKENDQWWYVKNKDGIVGYAYAQYLQPVE